MPYLPLQRPLDQFGVLLRGAVAVAQFAVVAVAPAEDLALCGEGQRVAVRAFGRRHLLDGAVWFERQLLERRLVVGVAQTQAAVAPLATRPHRAVRGDDKRAVLARLNLQSRPETYTTLGEIQLLVYSLRQERMFGCNCYVLNVCSCINRFPL